MKIFLHQDEYATRHKSTWENIDRIRTYSIQINLIEVTRVQNRSLEKEHLQEEYSMR